MTTNAQVERAVAPLLHRQSDLAYFDRWIIVKPVRHAVRTFLVDRTSSKDMFTVHWCIMHLFNIRTSIFLNWGRELYPPYKGVWKWSNPAAIPALHEVIEQALPRVRSIATIADLMRELPDLWRAGWQPLPSNPLDVDPFQKVAFNVALGNLDVARTVCAEKICPRDVASFGRDDEDKAKLLRFKELCRRLAANDRAGLAALLHEWEAATVKNLKLEHLWEPTPFPLEEMPAAAG